MCIRDSHWDGPCPKSSPEPYCEFNYSESWAKLWDDNYPNTAAPALTAVFVQDNNAPAASEYIAASHGADGSGTYAALMEALFSADNTYRYLNLQASTRNSFDREPRYYLRQSDSLLATSPSGSNFTAAGGATATLDIVTLVDTDAGDNDISVTTLIPKRSGGQTGQFVGTYYCGIISTDGTSRFVRVVADGAGGGLLRLEQDRQGFSGQTAIGYSVADDGTMTFSYNINVQLAGSLSADGSFFTGTQVQSSAQGAIACMRRSSDQTLGTAAGRYYGAWSSVQPVTGVTELVVDVTGQTLENVLRDSGGGRNYSLGQDFMLVLFDGQVSTGTERYGMLSGDRRVLFLVSTDASKFPTLVVYIRQGS